ncbi:Dihydroorotate dehydrogenase B (NAD(+)), electron transfer subunit [bioreactor metagenome]|uniref:Dihydroorotate dehydrogenase B (NAD(+)), electron transfer subunit n=1 Tax=bioreactor metagenome TaxID=1076179 RepID=A0A645JJ63_9ZZZZ
MLKAVCDLSEKYKVPCYFSLEERMGCGVGACLTCACKISSQEGSNYMRVCRDGPVFRSDEVVFDD